MMLNKVKNTGGLNSYDPNQLLALARDWLKQGNITVAFHLLNEALKQNNNSQNNQIKGEIAKEYGRAYMQDSQWDRAEESYNQAMTIFIENGNYRGAAESIRNLANMKFQLGLFDDSSSLCQKAIDLAVKSGDFQLRATILNTQGAIKSIRGNQKESLKIFGLCLSDLRRSGNKSHQAHILHNMGLANMEIGEYSEAKRIFEEALALAIEVKNSNLVQICYHNMARLHLKMDDLVAARSLAMAARKLLESVPSPSLETDLALIDAEVLKVSGNLAMADNVLTDALKLARENNLLQQEAEILYEAGLVSIELGDYNIARSRLEASITLLKKTGGSQLDKAVKQLKNLESMRNTKNTKVS